MTTRTLETEEDLALAERRARAAAATDVGAMPYLNAAVPIGLIGAGAVALYILLLDSLSGHALGTPSALGATLLLGETFDPTASVRPALVFGYTLLHVATFVAVACGAVSAEYTLRRNGISLVTQVILGVTGLFAVLQTLFIVLAMMLGVAWVGEIGFERILTANLIAALTMALALVVRSVRQVEKQARA